MEKDSEVEDRERRLPDTCLFLLWSKFSIWERMTILESVCRRWRKLMNYTDVEFIDFADIRSHENCLHQMKYFIGNNIEASQRCMKSTSLLHMLKALALRLGKNNTVKSIRLESVGFRCLIDADIMRFIVEHFPNIQSISLLSGFIVTQEVIPLLRRLARLRELRLGMVRYLDGSPNRMLLSYDGVSQHMEEVINSLSFLCVLDLSSAQFCPQISNHSLVKLYLGGVQGITNDKLAHIAAHCQTLVELELPSTGSTNFFPIAALKSLRRLWLSSTQINNSHLESVCKNLSSLEDLRLDGCINLTDFAPVALHLKSLRSLWVGPTQFFTDEQLVLIAERRLLRSLTTSDCPNVTDLSVRQVAISSPELLEINVPRCIHVSSISLVAVVKCCPNIATINANSTRVSGIFLKQAGSDGQKLKMLFIQDCPFVDAESFSWFAQKRKVQMNESTLASFSPLTILYGGSNCVPIPNDVFSRLKKLNVTLINRGPLLALPAT